MFYYGKKLFLNYPSITALQPAVRIINWLYRMIFTQCFNICIGMFNPATNKAMQIDLSMRASSVRLRVPSYLEMSYTLGNTLQCILKVPESMGVHYSHADTDKISIKFLSQDCQPYLVNFVQAGLGRRYLCPEFQLLKTNYGRTWVSKIMNKENRRAPPTLMTRSNVSERTKTCSTKFKLPQNISLGRPFDYYN